MCKRNLETAELLEQCCYGHQFNGTHCYTCAIGYTGQKCEIPCDGLYYGHLCSTACECPRKQCHHIYGCSANESVGSSMAVYTIDLSKSSEPTTSSFIDSTSLRVNTTPAPSTTEKKNIITNSVLLRNVSEELQSSRIMTSSTQPVTTSPKLLENSTLILVIGGLIAFFLCILSIQACVKLHACICRKRKSKRVVQKRDSVQEEETYEDINEARMISVSRTEDPKQQKKYYDLKVLDKDTIMPYHKLDKTLGRLNTNSFNIEEVRDEFHSSSISCDSTGSSDSYLKPVTKKHEKHNYIEVLDTASSNDELIDINGQNYRVHRDSAYLDVIAEKTLDNTYLDVVHCTDTGNNS